MEFLYVLSCVHKLLTLSRKQDRLENEHLGNMDQYRATREVPLPYSFDEDAPLRLQLESQL
jgi:hypothetical protein